MDFFFFRNFLEKHINQNAVHIIFKNIYPLLFLIFLFFDRIVIILLQEVYCVMQNCNKLISQHDN